MALAKQFEIQVNGRGTLTDPDVAFTAANLAFEADIITINGVAHKVSTLDEDSVTAITGAMETIVSVLNKLSQTITMGSASIADDETLTITLDGLTLTYVNETGGAVLAGSAALATAVKAAADADEDWTARFTTVVSSNNLVITQKGVFKKLAAAVIGGTGVGEGEITVA